MRRGNLTIFSVLFSVALFAASALAADIRLAPASGSHGTNQDFTVDVRISAPDESINAAQGKLQFDPSVLQVKSISREGSVFNFWLQEPTFSNSAGTIEFIGGVPSGISGASLKILTVTFTGKAIGSSTVVFSSASITAADGSGTDVVGEATGAQFFVTSGVGQPTTPGVPTPPPSTPAPVGQPTSTPLPATRQPIRATGLPGTPVITVPLYPEQGAWYNLVADFSSLWDLPDDVSDVAATLNQNPTYVVPTSLANIQGACCGMNFSALIDDGTYFVHVRFQNNIGWGSTAHYRINLDTTPPVPFTIEVMSGLASDDPSPVLSFQAGDTLSGIASYVIQVGNEPPIIRTPGDLMAAEGRSGEEAQTELRIIPTGIGYLNIRSQPTTAGEVVGRATPGDSYVYTEQSDGWYRVVSEELPGGFGWVIGTYVETSIITGSGAGIAEGLSSALHYQLAPHAPGIYPILIRAIDHAGNSTEARTEIEILPIDTPLVTDVSESVILDTDDSFFAKGIALPDTDILITIEDKDHFLVTESIAHANLDGEWEFTLDRDLRRGKYTVVVRARDSRGALSLPSEPFSVAIREKPLIVLFGLELTLRWLLMAMALLLVGFALYYWRAKIVRFARNQRESVIIGRDLTNAFNQVREALNDHAKNLGEMKLTKEHKVEHEQFFKKVTKSLDKVEKYVKPDVERLK